MVGGIGALLILMLGSARIEEAARARQLLRDALRDERPEVRRAAATVMTTHGLRRVAPILVKRLHEEDDSEVRSAISRAVERNQWESVDTPALAQLRTWAETATAHDGERAVAPDGEVRAPSGTGGNPEHRRPAARRTNTYRLVVLTIAWAIFAFETWLYVRSR